jgi:hypothetical protein
VERFGHGGHAWLILQGPKALQMLLLPGGPRRSCGECGFAGTPMSAPTLDWIGG